MASSDIYRHPNEALPYCHYLTAEDRVNPDEKGACVLNFPSDTIRVRMPNILGKVMTDNADRFTVDCVEKIKAIQHDLVEGKKMTLEDKGLPHLEAWVEEIQEFDHLTTHTAPWWTVENWMYRRLLQAMGYFNPGGLSFDPFASAKAQSNEAATGTFLSKLLPLSATVEDGETLNGDTFKTLLMYSLWGNRADLSLSAGKVESTGGKGAEVLVDHSEEVWSHLLSSSSPRTVLFVLDNCGLELISDLVFVEALLRSHTVETVILHCKADPVFVSDVMEKDIEICLSWMDDLAIPAASTLAASLRGFLRVGKLQVSPQTFYNTSRLFWEMPEALAKEFMASNLTIAKGDANYRRLVGDKKWDPVSTSFEDVVGFYFPGPLVALRTLKSNSVVGLTEEAVTKAESRNEKWLVDGSVGIIQFTMGRTTK